MKLGCEVSVLSCDRVTAHSRLFGIKSDGDYVPDIGIAVCQTSASHGPGRGAMTLTSLNLFDGSFFREQVFLVIREHDDH